MRQHILPEGTVLDERYRIEAKLGEGGFGITYAARNIRLDSEVAVKEFFWRGHCERDVDVGAQVTLSQPEDEEAFERQKSRFLYEARTLRDFSDRGDIARVLDYFEANGTAYIVMERVHGETLSAYIAAHGPMDALEAFRRFLPLTQTLGAIHAAGVIHRDISPDNIMMQPDGRLKLIDFGAARQFTFLSGGEYSVITRDSFAPPEQYDRKGVLGPWTDIYALCATLYVCVTGQTPISSMQRMFVDELRAPSQLRPDIDGKCEAIILRGMNLSAQKRWQSMEELAEALRGVLPAPDMTPQEPSLWSRVLLIAAALLLAAALMLGIPAYRQYRWAHRFEHIVTETFDLIAPAEISARDFAQAQRDLDEELIAFAGKDNYITAIENTRLRVTLPLELFHGSEIGLTLSDVLSELLDTYGFDFFYQIQANWEDPATSLIAGANQVRSEDLKGETAIFACERASYVREQTSGQRASAMVDIKTRLDALDTPYAFGTAYGDPGQLVYRIDPSRVGRFVTETVGNSIPLLLAGECEANAISVCYDSYGSKRFEVIDNADGSFSLRYVCENPQELLKLTRSLIDSGRKVLYLQTSHSDLPLARLELQAPIEDGVLEFREFMFEGLSRIDAEHRYILDYIASLANDTCLSQTYFSRGEGIWTAKGDLMLDEDVDEHFGLSTRLKDEAVRLRDTLTRIREEKANEVTIHELTGTYFIQFDLPRDETLTDRLTACMIELLEEYKLADFVTDQSISIVPLVEAGDERYRIYLDTMVYIPTGAQEDVIYHKATCYFEYVNSKTGELPPFAEELREWWAAFPSEKYGISKEYY